MECRKNWDDYQEQWRMQGYEHEHMEYPYTRGEVTNWNGWLGTRGNQMEDSSSRDLFDPEVSKSWWLRWLWLWWCRCRSAPCYKCSSANRGDNHLKDSVDGAMSFLDAPSCGSRGAGSKRLC